VAKGIKAPYFHGGRFPNWAGGRHVCSVGFSPSLQFGVLLSGAWLRHGTYAVTITSLLMEGHLLDKMLLALFWSVIVIREQA
jgi:hypothetical protein